MKNRGILGIMIVIAMVMTAVPVMSGQAKADAGNLNDVPDYIVIVRDIPEPHYVKSINKTIGNAYEDSRFGVEIIVRVKDYAYYPRGPDEIHLNITGIGVKGSNAGNYKVKWFEIGSTKFSFEGLKSDQTPQATDYFSSVNAVPQPYVGVGLRGHVNHQEVKWFKAISGEVASTATSLAIDYATGGVAGPLSGLAGTGASYLVQKAIDNVFNVNQNGINYRGSDTDPWSPTTNYPHTYTLLRGVTDGSADDPNRVLLARSLQWNLYDGINDRIHVLTLKAVLCYAKYGNDHWSDEHEISTSVTIYLAPEKDVKTVTTKSGESITTLSKSLSDPVDTSTLDVYPEDSEHYEAYDSIDKMDTTPTNHGLMKAGITGDDIDDEYHYYQGALTYDDSVDAYESLYEYQDGYEYHSGYLWIYASGDLHIVVTAKYLSSQYGYLWKDIHLKGGHCINIDLKWNEERSIKVLVAIYPENSMHGCIYYILSPYMKYIEPLGDNDSSGGGVPPGGGGEHPPIPYIVPPHAGDSIYSDVTAECVIENNY